MSSMVTRSTPHPVGFDFRPRFLSALPVRSALAAAAALGAIHAAPAAAQQRVQLPAEQFGAIEWGASDWDKARTRHMTMQPGPMAYAVGRWKQLTAPSTRFAFTDYADFLARYPDLPDEDKLQLRAEATLDDSYVDPGQLVAFFDRRPPMTNPARAQYALALRAVARPEAQATAREAWRRGTMTPVAEATLFAMYGGVFSPEDHAARMDALLWQGDRQAAERQIAYVQEPARSMMMVRLAALQGTDPALLGLAVPSTANADPGYLYNRAQQLRQNGMAAAARSLLAHRPALAIRPPHPERWLTELRVNVESGLAAGDIANAIAIAHKAGDAFAPGTDISMLSAEIRDEYEKLMYPTGEAALRQGDPATAARLFEAYGSSQRTAPARTKGFYWAGIAAQRAGDRATAQRNFESAAAYPDQFYGQLALEQLQRPLTAGGAPLPVPSAAARAAFHAQPLVQAVREVARVGDWRTAVYFFRTLGQNAETPEDFALIAELARETGRRDLGVIAGREASTKQIAGFAPYAFPQINPPPGHDASWTMIHAIARQESQFATDALSHAGARGLMQLMPGTAREQAGKIGLSYSSNALIDSPSYNMQLGSSYFSRMMDVFGGSYPLAVAAYNAGPGNVGKWLRQNGDPRRGGISWIAWIEAIPFRETRIYVTRVLENAAYYDALYPRNGNSSGAYPLSHYLGKRPGS